MLEVNLFSSVLLIILFAILYFKKRSALPNKILALAFLIPGIAFFTNVLIQNGMIYSWSWTYFVGQILAAIMAPLTFYYITLMTGETSHRFAKLLFFITILIVFYAIYLTGKFYMSSPGTQRAFGITKILMNQGLVFQSKRACLF